MKLFKKDPRANFTLGWIVFALALFSFIRLLLFILYHSVFASLTMGQVLNCFIQGIRFDLTMVALFLGPLLIFLNIPVKNKYYVKTISYLLWFMFCALLVFLVSDLVYFPNVKRHIAEELIHISADWGFIFTYAFKSALLPVLVVFAFIIAGGYFVSKIAGKAVKTNLTWVWQSVKFILLILFLIIGIRGHLGFSKPLGIADVYKYAKTSQEATLMLNGVFTGYHVWRKGGVDIKNNYSLDKAIKNTQELLLSKDEIVPDREYPLMRVNQKAKEQKDLNFVVIMLEGWNPKYISSETTPNMAKIQKEGVNFTNAYAIGLRSILGFAAIYASVPLVPGLPVFGYGLELTTFSPPFKNFADNGYYTFFAQTSLRHSFRLCSLATYLGAQESYGWEDMPMILDYIDEAPYGYDYELLMFAADKIKNRKQDKFFAGLFTGITHEPWTRTQEQFMKYDNNTWEGGYKNTLFYSDWSIGEFLKKAKEDGWFDNTVFIFLSDHNYDESKHNDPVLKEKFHIPLTIYAPKIFKPSQIDYVVSQTDIVPTLYNLAGLNMPYTAFGKDLFDNSVPRFAFISEGVNIGIIEKEGSLRSDRTSILEEQKDLDTYDSKVSLEKLLSLDKAAYELLKGNKWFKNE